MRLSEAIMLGHSEIRPTNGFWLERSDDGSCAGCAAGAALWAMGHRSFPRDAWTIEEALGEHWPWVKTWNSETYESFGQTITSYFGRVLCHSMTIEELADWVRSIEPEEQVSTGASVESSTNQLVEREEVHVR